MDGAAPFTQRRLSRNRAEAVPARGAREYAQALLADLRGSFTADVAADSFSKPGDEEHPALAWAGSGAMLLTGAPLGEPQMCPVPLAACADGALMALASLAPHGALDGVSGARLLGERAAISAFMRAGPVSPGGSCRLLEAADGWFAANLTRDDDWALVPAWLEADAEPGWELVRSSARSKTVQELVERGRLLGLAVAADEAPGKAGCGWFRGTCPPLPLPPLSGGGGSSLRSPVVVDLSSLWAGPLCGHLLQKCGARVIKVESPRRPDGARRGPAAFYDLMNAGKLSVAIDPATLQGRAHLRALIGKADIVIESSRPRALRQFGLDPETLLRDNRGLTWISITGHGRGEPQENWVAFGDDAGVAAGLSQLMHQATAQRLICGDAIADPLTGLHAALAAWCGFLGGGAGLISVALCGVVRHCIQFDLPASEQELRERQRSWTALAASHGLTAKLPQARAVQGSARALGTDTAAVFSAGF